VHLNIFEKIHAYENKGPFLRNMLKVIRIKNIGFKNSFKLILAFKCIYALSL